MGTALHNGKCVGTSGAPLTALASASICSTASACCSSAVRRSYQPLKFALRKNRLYRPGQSPRSDDVSCGPPVASVARNSSGRKQPSGGGARNGWMSRCKGINEAMYLHEQVHNGGSSISSANTNKLYMLL